MHFRRVVSVDVELSAADRRVLTVPRVVPACRWTYGDCY